MFCTNCGNEIADNTVVCVKCGVPVNTEKKFCPGCGCAINSNQAICVKCGISLETTKGKKNKALQSTGGQTSSEKNRTTAGILALLLGGIGVHEFYLGNHVSGIIRILITIIGAFIFFLGPCVSGIIALIEGIKFLTMDDATFQEKYIDNKKGWF